MADVNLIVFEDGAGLTGLVGDVLVSWNDLEVMPGAVDIKMGFYFSPCRGIYILIILEIPGVSDVTGSTFTRSLQIGIESWPVKW